MGKVLIILFLSINSVLSATNYYVKNGGNDLALGTSDASAWAHHPWMTTWTGRTTLVAGDNVFMKRGDIWSIAAPSAPFITVAQNGVSGNPITTTWYGASGNKPLIQITGDYAYPVIKGFGKSFITFDNLEIKHFSAVQDLTNSQDGIEFGKDASNNVPHDWIITNCNIHNIPLIGINGFDDSYNILIGNASATSCATVLSYSNHIYDCGYGGIILLGRDRATNHSHWNVCYNYIHDIDTSGGLRDSYGIAFSSGTVGTGQGYSTGWPDNTVAKYNRIENIPGHTGIDCHGGKNIYFQDNYIYDCLHGIIVQAADRSYAEPAILDSVFIERNTVENSGNSALDHYVFIYVEAENVLYRVTNCYIRDNIIFYTARPSAENGAYGISLYNVDGVTVEGNKIYNGPIGNPSGGIGLGSDAIKKVKNVIVRNNWIRNWDKGIDIEISSIDGDLIFYNNIVYSHNRPFVGEGGTISNNIKIYNNTFLSIGTAAKPYTIDFVSAGAVTIAKGASLTIKNNIFGFTSSASSGIYIYAPATVNGTLIIDNNLYWNSTYYNPLNAIGTSYNWTGWNAHGYDVYSPNATTTLNPQFINTSGSYSSYLDFVLQGTSPAINKGTVVNEVNRDFFSNSRDATPDIGAYEYSVSVQPISVTGISVIGAGGSNTITTDKGTLQLVSSVSPSDAANKTVTWSITNGAGQATISSAGLVSAIYNGTVTARATATDGSGVYGILLITISNQAIPVTGIVLSGAGGTVTINTYNGTLQLNAAVSPSNATNKSVTWSIANGRGQATINSAGLVSAIDNGTVTARATATDGSGIYGTLFITITNQIVTDSLVLVNSVIENNSPAVLEVVYNIPVANVIPATSAFSVIVNSTDRNINTMTISGTKVLLTLASPVANSDIITVTYSKPSANPLQAASGGQAASVGPLTVTNKVSPKSYVSKPVKIFPNPAHDFINIQIVEPTLVPDFIRIISLTGKIVFQDKVKPAIKDFRIPIKLMQGVYILLMGSGNQILFTQKLIVAI